MDEPTLRARLHAAIVKAYGPGPAPRRDFVARALARPFPYPGLLQVLTAEGFSTTDTTDGNDDIAWHLGLRRGADEVDAMVSMAGPFAHVAQPVSTAGGVQTLRDEIDRIFRRAGLQPVPDAMLAEPSTLVEHGRMLDFGQALFAGNDR